MSLTTETALLTLVEQTGQALNGHEQLARRVADVQALMRDDLRYVERELQASAQAGCSPGDQAALQLLAAGGKRVRPLALLLACRCFGPITGEAREMATAVELVHSATLLHDDVLDEGTHRRGVATSRMLWGNAVSILTGDLLLVDALQRTQRAAPGLISRLLETLRRLVNGEILQLRGRAQLDASEATYLQILNDKTASLFSFAACAGAVLGGASGAHQTHLARFGSCLGTAFQLVDDALDYETQSSGKTLLADLSEGKLTLPLVLACAKDPSLIGLVESIHAGDSAEVLKVSERVLASGVCEEVRHRARKQTQVAVEALSEVPFSGARSLLENVAVQLVERLR